MKKLILTILSLFIGYYVFEYCIKFLINESINFNSNDSVSKSLSGTLVGLFLSSPKMFTIISTILFAIFIYQILEYLVEIIEET